MDFVITDGYGVVAPLTNTVPSGTTGTNVFFPVADNGGWYDLTVTASGEVPFLRRLAGRIETGFPQPTATNASGATSFALPPLVIIPPAPFVLPGHLSPVPDINSLNIVGTLYSTNFVLIYPAWATNYTVESSTEPVFGPWTEVPPTTNSLGVFSNYVVIPLPMNSPGRFFRLRR